MMHKILGRNRAVRVLIGIVLLVCAQAGTVLAQDGFLNVSSLVEDSDGYRDGQVLVRFSDSAMASAGSGLAGPRSALSQLSVLSAGLIDGATVQRDLSHIGSGLALVALPAHMSVQNAVAVLMQSSSVIYAEPNYKRFISAPAIPGPPVAVNDPLYPQQWGLENGGNTDINAPEAWGWISETPDTIVAVLDTGIDYNHPDLFENLWYEVNIPEDYDIEDPNTYPDPNDFPDLPPFDPGAPEMWLPWRIYGIDVTVDPPIDDPFDDHFHGTHVAGIIGAVGNNGMGITGVTHKVQLMGVKVLDANGFGDVAWLIDGIDYAIEKGARVMNASLEGDRDSFSMAEYAALVRADEAGIVLVAAAGNSGNERAAYPARYGTPASEIAQLYNVISVAATDRSDQLASFSNYGKDETHLAAPGVSIISTMPVEATPYMEENGLDLLVNYATFSGTSQAAPHVAGAVALSIVLNPELSPSDVQRRLQHRRAVEPTLPDLTISGGRLNLYKYLQISAQGEITRFIPLDRGFDAVTYGWRDIQKAIDDAASEGVLDQQIVAHYGYVYEVPKGPMSIGQSVTVRSGDSSDPGVVSTKQQSYKTAVWAARFQGPVSRIQSGAGEVRIANLAIEDAEFTGGIIASGASLTLETCFVNNNVGNGVYCRNGGSHVIRDSRIYANSTLDSAGGGIFADRTDAILVEDCVVYDNDAGWAGGGICLYETDADVQRCDINNNASQQDGGGLYCGGSGTMLVQDCFLTDNYAELAGGAVAGYQTSAVRINNCLMTDNMSNGHYGGAVYCFDSSPKISNCTIARHDVLAPNGVGGAVLCDAGSSPVIADNIFVDNNDVAIYELDGTSNPTLRYNIFHNNPHGDYYDYQTGTGYRISAPEAVSAIDGAGNFSADPMFVPGRLGAFYLSQFVAGQVLDVNGAPAMPDGDPAAATSPAVDAGSDAAESLGMHLVSTRTDNYINSDGHRDEGVVDIGFHYVDPNATQYFTLERIVRLNGAPGDYGTIAVVYPADPNITSYRQFAQLLVQAQANEPESNQFASWTFTDDDTRIDLDAEGRPLDLQNNVVTVGRNLPVDYAVGDPVPIIADYETIWIALRAWVSTGNGIIEPRRGEFLRGTTVDLNVVRTSGAARIRWIGSDDDTSRLLYNTITMSPPFSIDPFGDELKEVEVQLYDARVLRVPSSQYETINEAIADANDGDIVSLAPSDVPYRSNEGFLIDRGITITSDNPADPGIVARTVIEFSAGAGGASRAFYFSGVGREAMLNGLTIRGWNLYGGDGTASSGDPGDHWGRPGGTTEGSAITCVLASPTIKNCVFVDCTAQGGNGSDGNAATNEDPAGGNGGWPGQGLGGAMACLWDSDPCVVNCTFENCIALGGNGGNGGSVPNNVLGWPGIGGGWDPRWNRFEIIPGDAIIGSDGGPFYDLDLTHTGMGGAVFVDRTSAPVFRNCRFNNCFSQGGRYGLSGDIFGYIPESKENYLIDCFGGAVFVGHYSNSYPLEFFAGGEDAESKARFLDCSFTANQAGSEPNAPVLDIWTSYGGAVAVGDGGDPTFVRCAFTQNESSMGGALYTSGDCRLNVEDSTVTENRAYSGGGIAVDQSTLALAGTVLATNQATEEGVTDPVTLVQLTDEVGQGGGVYVADGMALLLDSELRANHAGASGGGVYNMGSPITVKNCLIHQNDAGAEGGGVVSTLFSDTLIRGSTIVNNRVEPSQSAAAGGRGGVGQTVSSANGFGGGLFASHSSVVKVYDTLLWDNVAKSSNAGNSGDQIAIRGGFEFTDLYRGDADGEPNDTGLEYSEGSTRVTVVYSDVGPSNHTNPASSTLFWPVYVEEPSLLYGWDAKTQSWDASTRNLDKEPRLTTGFYLSHIDAGQSVDSPLIDAGSVLADDPNAQMETYTTRTDSILDTGIVDIGYHYLAGLQRYTMTAVVVPDADDGLIHGRVDPNRADVLEVGGMNVVTLRATPDQGYRLAAWRGTDNDSLTTRTNTVTLTEDRLVRVYFEKLSTQVLTVPGSYPTIQAAVAYARDGDEIVVDPGIYYAPDIDNIYSLVVDKAITVRSNNPEDPATVAATIIDGYTVVNPTQRRLGVLFGRNSTGAVFNGLTIQNCSGKAGNGDPGDRTESHPNGYDGMFIMGGGMYVAEGAAPIIKNCIVRDCLLEGGDGGDGVNAQSGDLLGNTFNAGRGGWGGFVRGAGAFCAANSAPIFINCTFEDNFAQGGDGGNGGDFDESSVNRGYASYGGNFTPADNVDYDPCEAGPTVENQSLWQVWRWDHALTYKYWDAVATNTIYQLDMNDVLAEVAMGGSYLGDYRYYSGYGGGVYCDQDSRVTFKDCVIRNNQVSGGQSGVGGDADDATDDLMSPPLAYQIPSYGAGLYVAQNATVTLQGCSLVSNIASGPNDLDIGGGGGATDFRLNPYLGHGGGLCAENDAVVNIVDCNVVANNADSGGGLYLSECHADIVDTYIARNEALRGAGLYHTAGLGMAQLVVRDCNVISNWAHASPEDINNVGDDPLPAFGGGMALISSNAQIWDCNLFSNDANASGGAIYIRDKSPLIANNLIRNNQAGRDGGAISINSSATPVIRNCTLHLNSATGLTGEVGSNGLGGAIYCAYNSDATILDSILWQNSALSGGEIAVVSGGQFVDQSSRVTIHHSGLWVSDVSLYVEGGSTIVQGEGMIYADPLFTLPTYHLSQTAAGQGSNSPCVDSGSNLAGNVSMSLFTTRTDEMPDQGQVDMGYHYSMRAACRVCDLEFDGAIDFYDFVQLANQWLITGCSSANGYCGGADITVDGQVNAVDLQVFSDCWLILDNIPPRPNPPVWFSVPANQGGGSVTMSAEVATDDWGWDVEYYFECASGNCHDSGWQSSSSYTDRVASGSEDYAYRVKVREARDGGNETEWSEVRNANPQPFPPAGTLQLTATELYPNAITVQGSMLEHPTGVDYRFERQANASVEGDLGEVTAWTSFALDPNDPANPLLQGAPQWLFRALEPETSYLFRYQARSAGGQSPTPWSLWVMATTLVDDGTGINDIPPTPNPSEWALTDPNYTYGTPIAAQLLPGTFGWFASMSAEIAVDDGGLAVEYYFECVTNSGFDSGWITVPTYQVQTGTHPGGLVFRVRTRDALGNIGEWSEMIAVPFRGQPQTPPAGAALVVAPVAGQ
ncbi:S8 family serine peptidase [Planctomycetota bacterium]